MESFWAYLAGFFDGDGSLHFQIVRQREYRYGFYIRSNLVFYQSTSCEEGLREIRGRLDAETFAAGTVCPTSRSRIDQSSMMSLIA